MSIGIENKKKRLLKYGVEYMKLYSIWGGMKNRCLNENFFAYKNYGGRGIKICQRWFNFENFKKDLGKCPEGKTLDRINNDGNYEPSNCRWATWTEQRNNARGNRRVLFLGKKKTVSQWMRELGIKKPTLFNRLNRGWSIKRAFTTPVKSYKFHA